MFLSFSETTAAQYGQTSEFGVVPQRTLDIDDPQSASLADEFFAAHPEDDANGDPDDLFLFPPAAWVGFLKGMGWTSTSIGPDIFLFDPADAAPPLSRRAGCVSLTITGHTSPA